jgi:hypothetical protein
MASRAWSGRNPACLSGSVLVLWPFLLLLLLLVSRQYRRLGSLVVCEAIPQCPQRPQCPLHSTHRADVGLSGAGRPGFTSAGQRQGCPGVQESATPSQPEHGHGPQCTRMRARKAAASLRCLPVCTTGKSGPPVACAAPSLVAPHWRLGSLGDFTATLPHGLDVWKRSVVAHGLSSPKLALPNAAG